MVFLDINDGSTADNLQIVMNVPSELKKKVEEGQATTKQIIKKEFLPTNLNTGASVNIHGIKWQLREKNPDIPKDNEEDKYDAIVSSPLESITVLNSGDFHHSSISRTTGSGATYGSEDEDTVGKVEESITKYPLQKKRHTLTWLREDLGCHLRPRSSILASVFRIRSTASYAIHSYFTKECSAFHVHTPILTRNDAEGAGEAFILQDEKAPEDPFFGYPKSISTSSHTKKSRKAKEKKRKKTKREKVGDYGVDEDEKNQIYLSVSGQLHAEIFASALSRVYTFGPTFRAENSNTGKHLAEFWMVEPEFAFIDANQAMQLAEDCLKYTIGAVLEACGPEVRLLSQYEQDEMRKDEGEKKDLTLNMTLEERLRHLVDSEKYEKLTYTEAIDILRTEHKGRQKKMSAISSGLPFEFEPKWGSDLASEHESFLVQHVGRGSTPVFVTDWPAAIKPFYARINDMDENNINFNETSGIENSNISETQKNPITCAAFDLLVPSIGELIGGSAREERYSILEERLRNSSDTDDKRGGELMEELDWYLDLRRFGSVPHAGWGMGFERLIQLLTGMKNIRDVSPVFRARGQCSF
eukprot:g1974.t1